MVYLPPTNFEICYVEYNILCEEWQRQDTIAMMVPCLCLFAALSGPFSEAPINKNVPEPCFTKNQVRVRTVWWTIQDSNL